MLDTMAPDTPGVFELWEDDELVFVGSTHFSWEITYHPNARERELLAEFEREHHRQPRFNARA
jgi:hypothetical protein